MVRITLLFLFVLSFVLCSKANELGLSDTLYVRKSNLSILLKSNNHIEKANFLNALYSPAHAHLKSYSSGLQLDSIVATEWFDETQTIEKSMLFTCTFENDGKEVLVDIFRWDATESKWIIDDQNYYFFDEADRLKQIEFQEYINAEYRLYTRIHYVYENDLLKYENRFDRIDEVETWNALGQVEYRYNANNTVRSVYLNNWDSYEGWITEFYEKYAYDSIGNLATQTGFDYEFYDGISKKKYELHHSYNESNKLVETVEYIPGWEEDVFVPEHKQENTYNASSNLDSETYSNWDYDSERWVGNVKLNYSDLTDGTKVYESTSFLWAKENRKWEESQKMEFFAENNFLTSDIENWEFIETYMPAYSFDNVVCDKIINSSWGNNGWANSGGMDYYFSDGTIVGVNEMEKYTVNVYPNPVVDVLNIKTDNFEEIKCVIRHLNGQIILQSNFQSRGQFQLSELTSGVYFVELYAQNYQPQIHKIIKQ